MAGLFNPSTDKNDNKYQDGYFTIMKGMLITTSATIPIRNISKIWVADISKKKGLSNWAWICLGLGVLLLGMSSSSDGFTDNSWMILPALALLGIAALIIIIWAIFNNRVEYALCIEPNSGSTEMYVHYNLQFLRNAQNALENAIAVANENKNYVFTYNITNGPTNELVIHGNNCGPIAQGKGNQVNS